MSRNLVRFYVHLTYLYCTGSLQSSTLGLNSLVCSRVCATFIGFSLSLMAFFRSAMFFSVDEISSQTFKLQTLHIVNLKVKYMSQAICSSTCATSRNFCWVNLIFLENIIIYNIYYIKNCQLGVTSVEKKTVGRQGIFIFFKKPFQILRECGSYVYQHKTNFCIFFRH